MITDSPLLREAMMQTLLSGPHHIESTDEMQQILADICEDPRVTSKLQAFMMGMDFAAFARQQQTARQCAEIARAEADEWGMEYQGSALSVADLIEREFGLSTPKSDT